MQRIVAELSWRAPELLRSSCSRGRGTQKGDVYSFSLILVELHGRNGPWSSTGLTLQGTPIAIASRHCLSLKLHLTDMRKYCRQVNLSVTPSQIYVHLVSVWPWPLTSDLENVSSSGLSHAAYFCLICSNISAKHDDITSREIGVNGRTDARTAGPPENSSLSPRRRLKINSLSPATTLLNKFIEHPPRVRYIYFVLFVFNFMRGLWSRPAPTQNTKLSGVLKLVEVERWLWSDIHASWPLARSFWKKPRTIKPKRIVYVRGGDLHGWSWLPQSKDAKIWSYLNKKKH